MSSAARSRDTSASVSETTSSDGKGRGSDGTLPKLTASRGMALPSWSGGETRSAPLTLPAGNRGETVEVFGVAWSFLTLNGLQHLLLPALNLSFFKLAMMIRLARAGTREVMLTDTVKFARAAGLSEGTILRRHVLPLKAKYDVKLYGSDWTAADRLLGYVQKFGQFFNVDARLNELRRGGGGPARRR